MFQIPNLSYHNVDSFLETEGYYYCETLSRLDAKQRGWNSPEGLDLLSKDLVVMKSEYLDLENLEIFMALLEHIEDRMEKAAPESPFERLR